MGNSYLKRNVAAFTSSTVRPQEKLGVWSCLSSNISHSSSYSEIFFPCHTDIGSAGRLVTCFALNLKVKFVP